MASEEQQEPQDYNLILAQKVRDAAARLEARSSGRSPANTALPPSPAVQRFQCRTPDVPGVDRAKLKEEILEIVTQHGAPARPAWSAAAAAAVPRNQRSCSDSTATSFLSAVVGGAALGVYAAARAPASGAAAEQRLSWQLVLLAPVQPLGAGLRSSSCTKWQGRRPC